MAIATFFPLVSALFVVALGLIVFFHGKRNRLNFTFFLFTFAVSIWLTGTFMMFLNKQDIDTVIFWDKFVYVGVIFIPAIMFHFGLALTKNTDQFWNRFMKLGYVLSFLFLLSVPAGLLVNGAYVYSWGAHTKALPLHAVFLLFFATYLSLWFRMVYAYYRHTADRRERRQVRLVFLGFAILAVFGSMGFLPAYGISVYPISYLSGLIFTSILAYAIFKLQLFDIRVVAAELFIFIIWILVSLQATSANTLEGRVLGWGVFSLIVLLGALLIRSIRKETEQRETIEAQEKELELVNQQQESLLHFISHEIKGYLTKNQATFAAIADGDYGEITPQLKDITQRALSDVRLGVDTVMSILDASNLKKGTMAFARQPFDLKQTVQQSADGLREAAQLKGLTLQVVFAPTGAYTVEGDEPKIRQHVIRNLIDNAIRYTPAGTIKVELSQRDHTARLVIQDSGVGITSEDMARLFTEGGHGKDSIKVNVHSTGYGLFIAKQVVEAQGGKIWAESDGAGKGSRFIVELPTV